MAKRLDESDQDSPNKKQKSTEQQADVEVDEGNDDVQSAEQVAQY
jgi:hypothetical protein